MKEEKKRVKHLPYWLIAFIRSLRTATIKHIKNERQCITLREVSFEKHIYETDSDFLCKNKTESIDDLKAELTYIESQRDELNSCYDETKRKIEMILKCIEDVDDVQKISRKVLEELVQSNKF